ncbi:hypothetical protein [Tautonia sociabilis]|uniref:Uncharacterized protein n=1 Tax=Tautonia sociabilis TaxID=2080755 RepID=A0A432MMS2_9BACT|nr:hypothetical protein [Tautonia sociabilis]RUL88743.1 hypothetical protein TsocGM_05105 [Tautonia sociabilis]
MSRGDLSMEGIAFDDHSGRGPVGEPGVVLFVGEEQTLRLWYGTFDAVLRLLHDLWWRDRRIGRLRLLADWIGDRGAFDPEDASGSIVADPVETRDALRLARDRLARRAEPGEALEAALNALIRALDAAIEADAPVRIDRL